MKKKWIRTTLLPEISVQKAFIFMRLTCFLLFASILSVQATAWSQQMKVNIHLQEVTFETLFKELGKQANCEFLFNHDLLESKGKISVSAEEKELQELLNELLPGLGLRFIFEENTVIIAEDIATPQQRGSTTLVLIRGVVTDANKIPLPGVNVVVKGTTIGTITDAQGKYSISLPQVDNMVLVFSFIGLKKKEVSIGKQTEINVTMEEDIADLGEVVVTGYQTISRERSAGSFSLVNGEAIANRATLTGSILESLEGLPGLNVNFGEGEEKFTLRGINTINATRTPLYIVDGVPISAANISLLVNEQDIKNVTILRDATAASIWGAQAANGVIVIVTRKGHNTDRKFKISYDGSFTYSGLPDYDYFNYMSSDTFIKNVREIFDPNFYTWNAVSTLTTGLSAGIYYPAVFPHELPMYRALSGEITESQRDQQLAEMAARNNRSQIEKYLMSHKWHTKQNISFLGGSENYSFYGSLAYEFNQDNTRDQLNKYALNLRQDFRLTPWMSFELATTLSILDNQYALQAERTRLNTLLPYMMLKDGNQHLSHANLIMYDDFRHSAEERSKLSLDYVPLDEIHNGFNKRNSFNARINAGLEIKLFNGLKYEGRFALQRNNAKSAQFYDKNSYITREELAQFTTVDATGNPVHHLAVGGGRYTEGNNYEKNWTIRNQFNFDRSFSDNEHHITALAGMEIQANRTTSSTNTIRNYAPQTMTYSLYNQLALANGLSSPVLQRSASTTTNSLGMPLLLSETEYRFVSLYANAAYTYLSKFSVNASIRMDQSNLFGSDKSVRYKPIWSSGVMWNMGRERFMENIHFVDRLNLRLSYGLGGNSPDPGQGGAYDIVLASNNANYSGLGTGYSILYPANNLLKWERTKTINFGIDYTLFNTFLSGSIDLYHKLTDNLLSDAPMNPATGWFSALSNLGKLNNKGFEFSLTSLNINNHNFTWQTSFSLSYNKNKIKKLYQVDPLTASSIVHQSYIEGYAMRSIFAYSWAGLDEMGDPQIYNTDGTKVKLTSQVTDIDAGKYMGTSQPLWFGSLTNSLKYQNFDLSFMFVYNLGHKMRNDVNTFYAGRAASNMHKDFDNRWRQSGDENKTNVPSYISNTSTDISRRNMVFYTHADINVLSASYVKLRDLTLAYSLPKQVCNTLFAEAVKIRVQVGNLFYMAANKEGIDPEAHNYYSGSRSTRFGPTWSAGLSINFK